MFLCQRLLQSSVQWMRMMAVEVKSDLSLCQWFLWLQVNFLHNKKNSFSTSTSDFKWAKSSSVFFNLYLFFKKEKSLFGFAALLMNNTPGVIFDAWDLVRSERAFCKRSPLQSAIYSRPRTCSYLPLWNAEWMNKRRSSNKGII